MPSGPSSQAKDRAKVAASITSLKHARSNLRRWMKPERRKVTPGFLGLFGSRAYVAYQPKGVVGIISPWIRAND
jgi:coniferyl-aldehyde dehydrogenase